MLLSYLLIVTSSIIGFWLTGRARSDANKANAQSRLDLCHAIVDQARGQRVIIDSIVALVLNNPPPKSRQADYARYEASKVIILKFQEDAKSRLPVLDCTAIANTEAPK